MRIVLVEPSHWHFEMYRPGIVRFGADVVGVVDRNPDIAARIGTDFGCGAWADLEEMLDALRPDFAFVFGAHNRMPSIARELIARRIPFSLEKPGGIHSSSVHDLLDGARDADLHVSVPFHYRLSSMAQVLGAIVPFPSSGFRHFKFYINAGSPLRFDASSPWLVHPMESGGGCMMNLAHHAVDFATHCTGARVIDVRSSISNEVLGLPVEDMARLHMRFDNGATAEVETGYTHAVHPGSYMGFHLEVIHRDFTASRVDDVLAMTQGPGSDVRRMPTNWNFKQFFADYACDALVRCQKGLPPVAGLDDLLTTVKVIGQAYATATASPGLGALVRLHSTDQKITT